MAGEPLLRVAHLADIHIGMENYGKFNPTTGLNSRLDDFLRSLDQALDEALAADVDLVVLAGDIYKTRDPSPTHQREFARRVRRQACLSSSQPVTTTSRSRRAALLAWTSSVRSRCRT